MDWLLSFLLSPLVEAMLEGLSSFLNGWLLTGVFKVEGMIPGISEHSINVMYWIVGGLAMSILTFNLLQKLFKIYILEIEGKSHEVSPIEYLKYYLRALFVIFTFTVFYGWFIEIIIDFSNQINNALIGSVKYNVGLLNGILLVLLMLIWGIAAFILIIQCLMAGIRLFVLRIGLPFAAIDLVNSEPMRFKSYILKFFQTGLIVIVQILLLQLSILPIVSKDAGFFSVLLSLALVFYAHKVDNDLNEFFMGHSSCNGMGHMVTSQVISSVKKIFVKG